jgi:hypothetical protein
MRYYQRGFIGFVIASSLCASAEYLLSTDPVSSTWFWRSRMALAIASAVYVVVPYCRRVLVLWREHVRPLLDLLSDRR